MAITYPLDTPTNIGFAQITLSQENKVSMTESSFTFQQQVFKHPGERWKASVVIPPVRRENAEPWVSFLMSLNGAVGSFLLGDPNCQEPQGTATTLVVTGNAQSSTLTATANGTLKAGDYFQLGSGETATLHKVLVDFNGTGDLEVWPRIRITHFESSAVLSSPKGKFRLAGGGISWTIQEASQYGIQFDCVEYI